MIQHIGFLHEGDYEAFQQRLAEERMVNELQEQEKQMLDEQYFDHQDFLLSQQALLDLDLDKIIPPASPLETKD